MPAPVSKKQMRLMHAILNSNKSIKCKHGRTGPPKSVAAKYKGGDDKNLPESKDQCKGGDWAKSKKKDKKKDKKKKEIRKSDDLNRGVGVIVLNDGRLLLGEQPDGLFSTPGGSCDEKEDFKETAIRELREETGLEAKDISFLSDHYYDENHSQTFVCPKWSGELKPNGEFLNLRFYKLSDIPWNNLRHCSAEGIQAYLSNRIEDSASKSLIDMLAYENISEALSKNIIRSGASNAVHEVTHGDALHTVSSGTFKMLREAVQGMEDDEVREFNIDNYVFNIRKHVNDVYSGRIDDGIKTVHQFTNRSLPALTTELMSVFEWYTPEDEGSFHQIKDNISEDNVLDDEAIEANINKLMEEYKKEHINDIYMEMENIREEIRIGNTIDIQQVEHRIMKLFDNLETNLSTVVDRHNDLAVMAGSDFDSLEQKLIELQSKVDKIAKKPVTINAYAQDADKKDSIHDEYYSYLSKPVVTSSKNGKISISFAEDWMIEERENFLKDLKAKVINKAKKD